MTLRYPADGVPLGLEDAPDPAAHLRDENRLPGVSRSSRAVSPCVPSSPIRVALSPIVSLCLPLVSYCLAMSRVAPAPAAHLRDGLRIAGVSHSSRVVSHCLRLSPIGLALSRVVSHCLPSSPVIAHSLALTRIVSRCLPLPLSPMVSQVRALNPTHLSNSSHPKPRMAVDDRPRADRNHHRLAQGQPGT